MKKWEKIENSINATLEKTISNVSDVVSSTTPSQIRTWKNKLHDQATKTKNNLLVAPLALSEKIKNAKSAAQSGIIDLQLNLNKKLSDSKTGKFGRFGAAASILALLEWVFMPFYKHIAKFLSSLQPTTLASGIVIFTVGTITGIGVYNNSQKIAQEAGLIERAPAAIQRELENRPKYYKRNEKELLIANVVVPSYIEGSTSLKKLNVDFTIISSNRYIREYFYDNSYLIEDVFNTRIEPMIPGFPLGDEGKLILKEKIKIELDALLKRMKIEGQIDQVYISSILAG